jgi:hypothetical protein
VHVAALRSTPLEEKGGRDEGRGRPEGREGGEKGRGAVLREPIVKSTRYIFTTLLQVKNEGQQFLSSSDTLLFLHRTGKARAGRAAACLTQQQQV